MDQVLQKKMSVQPFLLLLQLRCAIANLFICSYLIIVFFNNA